MDETARTIADVLAGPGPYVAGWTAGWILLWRLRPLPPAPGSRRPIAVVIPARDEADVLGHVVAPLAAALRPGDELIVVDDHSSDGTADVARALGARVLVPPALPDGWLGKPHACWHGALATTAPVLAFVDADVRPRADLLDRLGGTVDTHPGEIVSVQPWHVVERPVEHLSVLFNVVALMAAGRFSVFGARVRARVAFGPVLAVDRDTYVDAGGHARADVRAAHTEDIALARAVGRVQLFTGRPVVGFRMYPGGFGDLVRGWTRSLATGARAAPRWAALLTFAWVWSLAAGWLVTPWFVVSSALQVGVLARRAGRFSPMAAVLYPVALVVFVYVFARSLVAVVSRREVVWKQRRLPAR